MQSTPKPPESGVGLVASTIKVSNKQPLEFYLSEASKALAIHPQIEISGLGGAVSTAVSMVETLKTQDLCQLKSIHTSLVTLPNQVQKPKIDIILLKSENFTEAKKKLHNWIGPQDICSPFNLHEDDILNLYQIGSRVYGTTDENSDWDFISVVPDGYIQKNLQHLQAQKLGYVLGIPKLDNGHVSTLLYEKTIFQDMLNAHEPNAIHCYFNPPQFIPKQTIKFNFSLSIPKLKSRFCTHSHTRWERARTVFWANRQYDKMRKWIVHSFRWLLFAKQLVQNPKLKHFDVTCANQIFHQVMKLSDQPDGQDFATYEKKFGFRRIKLMDQVFPREKIPLSPVLAPPRGETRKLTMEGIRPIEPDALLDMGLTLLHQLYPQSNTPRVWHPQPYGTTPEILSQPPPPPLHEPLSMATCGLIAANSPLRVSAVPFGDGGTFNGSWQYGSHNIQHLAAFLRETGCVLGGSGAVWLFRQFLCDLVLPAREKEEIPIIVRKPIFFSFLKCCV